METSLYRKTLITSLIITIISVGALITGLFLPYEGTILFPALVLTFSLLALITLGAFKLENKDWVRKSTKYSIFVFPLSLAAAIYISFINENMPVSFWIFLIITIIMAIMAMIHLFIFTNAVSVSGVILLLLFILIGIFFKRQHWPTATMIITIFSFLFSAASFMFGIRCLFLSEGIKYFRNVSFYGSCALSIAILGLSFKMQHWMGAGYFVIIGLLSQILGTLYLLITITSSGFVDWKPFHKKILRKILIPWTFFFFLMVSRFMVPELNTLIWTPDARKTEKKEQTYGFHMKDYQIENKNGIKE
jgi:hypothetical protein